jgi:hypothetical protein
LPVIVIELSFGIWCLSNKLASLYEFKNTNRGSGCHNIFLAAFVLPVKRPITLEDVADHATCQGGRIEAV